MSQSDDDVRAYLLFDPAELEYDFGEGHPLKPRRLIALMDLLESSGLLSAVMGLSEGGIFNSQEENHNVTCL